jgi:hypothetical protein
LTPSGTAKYGLPGGGRILLSHGHRCEDQTRSVKNLKLVFSPEVTN